MPTIFVNGVSIAYPDVGDSNWGTDATNFAIQVAAALGKIGQSSFPTTNDITVSPGNLSVTSGDLSVGGNVSVTGTTNLTGNVTLTNNLTVNGNATLGNGTSDTTAISGILNVDSGVLFVDPTSNKVGINDATPSVELDVNGSVAISGTLGVTGATSLSSTLGVTGDVAVNTNKFNVTASSGNTTIAGTLGVSGNTTIDGVTYLDDDTTANTPVLSFTGDTNTGIGRSAADTLDFITNGNSRFRIESTGQIKTVYESTIGTDYNATLRNAYLCRAWVNFDGTLSNTIGTYTRSGTTITCAITSHGLTTGQTANLDFTSGGATDGIYVVTVTNANTFTVEDTVSGTITTSNVTMLSRMIRASGNVSSITYNGTGSYNINFTTDMPDVNYAVCTNSGSTATASFNTGYLFSSSSASACQIRSANATETALEDKSVISVAVFR